MGLILVAHGLSCFPIASVLYPSTFDARTNLQLSAGFRAALAPHRNERKRACIAFMASCPFCGLLCSERGSCFFVGPAAHGIDLVVLVWRSCARMKYLAKLLCGFVFAPFPSHASGLKVSGL